MLHMLHNLLEQMILCLPAHTTYILEPLDVGVLKTFFTKACTSYIAKHPGRVITAYLLASLVAEAWPCSLLHAVNIMSWFKKCSLFPFSAVDDRKTAPSKAFQVPKSAPTENYSNPDPSSPLFSSEQKELG